MTTPHDWQNDAEYRKFIESMGGPHDEQQRHADATIAAYQRWLTHTIETIPRYQVQNGQMWIRANGLYVKREAVLAAVRGDTTP